MYRLTVILLFMNIFVLISASASEHNPSSAQIESVDLHGYSLYQQQGSPFESNEDFQRLQQQAKQSYEQKKYEESLNYLRQAMEKSPCNQSILFDIGACRYMVGDYSHAADWFTKAESLNSYWGPASYLIALSYDKSGAHELACFWYRKYLNSFGNPKDPRSTLQSGNINRRFISGRLKELDPSFDESAIPRVPERFGRLSKSDALHRVGSSSIDSTDCVPLFRLFFYPSLRRVELAPDDNARTGC